MKCPNCNASMLHSFYTIKDRQNEIWDSYKCLNSECAVTRVIIIRRKELPKPIHYYG